MDGILTDRHYTAVAEIPVINKFIAVLILCGAVKDDISTDEDPGIVVGHFEIHICNIGIHLGYDPGARGLFQVEHLEVPAELRHPEIRMTLDYPEDYEFIKAIFHRLYSPGKIFSLVDILSLLRDSPELMDINRKVQEAYTGHLKESAAVKLKDIPSGSP